jgi:hypothetical protein
MCDERGFIEYIGGSQGFFQWVISDDYQEQSQDPNSPFYGMTLEQYLNAIGSKYEDRATAMLNNFSTGVYSYGICPCSWVNDSFPQRGQVKTRNADRVAIDWFASFAYVEHPTQYGTHFKVY